jgi:hypothetical protein
VLVVLLAGCSTGSAQPQVTGLPSVHPGAGLPPRLVEQLRIPNAGYAAAIAGGANGLWLAVRPPPGPLAGPPTAGQLQQIDPTSGVLLAHWAIGGSPVGLAVAASVWIADGPGPGPDDAVGANQVTQFNMSGQLVGSYPVSAPLGVAAQGDDAVVTYQQRSGVYLQRLSSGRADPAVKLTATSPNPGTSLVWCPDHRLWAASFDDRAQRIHLQQFVATSGQPLRDLHSDTILAAAGTTTLACQPHGLAALVADLDHATLFLLPRDGPVTSPRAATATPAGALVSDDAQRLWLLRAETYPGPDAQVQLLNGDDLTTGPPLTLPSAANVYGPTGTGVWVAAHDPQNWQAAVLTYVTAQATP